MEKFKRILKVIFGLLLLLAIPIYPFWVILSFVYVIIRYIITGEKDLGFILAPMLYLMEKFDEL